MSSHFACIGFPVKDMEEYWSLARRAAAEGQRTTAPDGGALTRWTPGVGVEIWTHLNAAGEILGAIPFFSTGRPYRISVIGSGDDPDEEMEGWIDGWLEPVEEGEPFSGAFPLRADLVNYALTRTRLTTFPSLQRIELAALAHEAELFDGEDAYRAAPGDIYRVPLGSFTSAAHFGADEHVEGFQESTGLFSARITAAQALANPVTGARFWEIEIRPQGVGLRILADQETLGGEPALGQIISGSAWLVAHLLEP
jgi:hypothetical protein